MTKAAPIPTKMQAEIICIGDELLIGQTINTNAGWLGEQLNGAGIKVARTIVIADDREDILAVLDEASTRSQLIIITGGLGPTKDDITKKTLCEYFGSTLIMHPPTLERVTAFFVAKNVPLLETNKQQALVPDNCMVIDNVRGTAPGMWFEKNGVVVVSMPGVPYEMKGIMEDGLLDKIKTHFKRPEIVHRTILTIGIGESILAEKISSWEDSLAEHNIKLAYLPSPGMVKLRMSCYNAEAAGNLPAVMEQKEEELKKLAGEYIYGHDKETLEEIVGKLLLAQNKTLSVAESCTGGSISRLITSVEGCSAYYKGGVTSYLNEIKTQVLGVKETTIADKGVVSCEVAEEMAAGVRKLMGTDFSISTTGIAGPSGGTAEIPVGTVCIAVAGPSGIRSARFKFGTNRLRNIEMTTNTALNLLRKEILESNAC